MTFTAVTTTRVFCRPGCPGRPKAENTERFTAPGAALVAGYRPCKRCLPLHPPGTRATREPDAPMVHLAVIATPLGPMVAAATDQHVVLLEFANRRMLLTQFRRLSRELGCRYDMEPAPLLDRLRDELAEYFGGRRTAFDVPVREPGTDFQEEVWTTLRRIPSGATWSYARLAGSIGRPAAVRAVARANGDNRLAILVPCHRVIGSNGELTGYSGGIWRKRKLLELEGGRTVGRSDGR